MNVSVKRVYDPPSTHDGCRVLVDRVWPRGVTKEKAALDLWLKEIAPSTGLRKWFGHEPQRWQEFKRRYFQELDAKSGDIDRLAAAAAGRRLTLLFAARDTKHNNAVALKEYLGRKVRS